MHVNVANVTFPNGSGSERPGPTCSPCRLSLGACSPLSLSPSDCLCIYFESVQFVRCVCEVRVIQTLQQVYCFDKRHHFTEKRGKTQTALRSRVKLERARYTEQIFVTLQTTIPERLLEHQQKTDKAAKIKERKERYVFTISPALSVYLC